MVLAAIDYIERNPRRLHHRRTRAAQVMRRPSAILAAGDRQGVVVALERQRLRLHNINYLLHICLLYNLHQVDILYAYTVFWLVL